MSGKHELDLTAFAQHHEGLRQQKEEQRAASAESDSLAGLVAPIAVEQLLPDPHQARQVFSEEKIDELARSLSQHGLLQPLIVRPASGAKNRGKYWVIAGERRLRAAQKLGWKEVNCRITNVQGVTAAVIGLVDNIQREDLTPDEKSDALWELKRLTGLSWDEIAKMVGLSPVTVRQTASLKNVAPEVREMNLPARTVMAIKALPEAEQIRVAEEVRDKGLTAEQVREKTKHMLRPRMKKARELAVPQRFQESPEPVRENAAAYEPVERQSRPGTRTRILEDAVQAVENIQKALGRESWAPSEVTPKQQELIHQLYSALSSLHQEVIYIRNPFRPEPTAEAKKLKQSGSKNLLPF